MKENVIESRLEKGVKKLGGKAYKWVSPGSAGVPDRIVILPGRIVFVETKRPGEKARKLQEVIHKRLRLLGCDVRVIDTVEGVDAFLEEMRQ